MEKYCNIQILPKNPPLQFKARAIPDTIECENEETEYEQWQEKGIKHMDYDWNRGVGIWSVSKIPNFYHAYKAQF